MDNLLSILSKITNLFSRRQVRSTDTGIFDPYLPIGSLKPLQGDHFEWQQTTVEDVTDVTVPPVKKSFVYVRLLVILLASILAVRLIFLQISEGQANYLLAEGNRLRTQLVTAPRGIFYDRLGKPLVQNTPNFSVLFQPSELPKNKDDQKAFISQLAGILGLDETALSNQIQTNKNNGDIVLLDNINRDQELSLELKLNGLSGVYIITSPTRQYAAVPSLGHLLGYISKADSADLKANPNLQSTSLVGKSGLEKQYDAVLQGTPGIDTFEVDSSNRVIRSVGSNPPKAGQSIYLSLDSDLQTVAANALNESIQKSGATNGAVVAMDVRTGEILSMVSVPGFDANIFTDKSKASQIQQVLNDPLSPLLNRAIAGQYPSGSTIKPVVLAGALQEKIVSATTRIDTSAGQISVGGRTFNDWKTHPSADGPQAIAESNNIYFFTVGGGNGNIKGLGAERLAKYMEKFGFGSLTGIDLPGEKPGNIPTPEWKKKVKGESWFIGDTYNMSIGQGDVLVTPLQMVRSTAAVANGGKLLQPRMVKSIMSPNGQTNDPVATKVLADNLVDQSYIQTVQQGMRQAVTSGSAQSFKNLPIQVAAKTGTAQITASKDKTHSWFTAYAPYDNPEIAVSVIVEGGGEGWEVAAPVAKNVIEQYFHLPITPILPPPPNE